MNSTQRKFLIERIQSKVKTQIEALKSSKLAHPSASNFLFKAVMNGTLQIQPSEVILGAIKEKALQAKEGQNWLSDMRMGWEKERAIMLAIESVMIIPDDYKEEFKRVSENNRKIDDEIRILSIQLDTIEVRIQLASDKTLQKLINEVDDMGDLSLIDTNLKLLTN